MPNNILNKVSVLFNCVLNCYKINESHVIVNCYVIDIRSLPLSSTSSSSTLPPQLSTTTLISHLAKFLKTISQSAQHLSFMMLDIPLLGAHTFIPNILVVPLGWHIASLLIVSFKDSKPHPWPSCSLLATKRTSDTSSQEAKVALGIFPSIWHSP